VAAPAAAQYQSPQGVKFQSATPYGSTAPYRFGVYNGPYQLELQSEPGRPSIDAFCVDFDNYVQPSWTANITNLASSDLSNTRLGNKYGTNAIVRARYQATAWLAMQMMTKPNSEWWKYHGAIWAITAEPGTSFTTPFLALSAADKLKVTSLVSQALTFGYQTVDPGSWAVITDVNMNGPNSSQEFITSVVPEPASIFLFGSALLLLGLAAYFRPSVLV
jgi:hypothetical protein